MPPELVRKSCVPCQAGTPTLHGAELAALAAQLPAWGVVEENHIHRSYSFPDFVSALRFVNQVGEVAEQEQHHPDISLGWGRVEISTHTHAIGGLSENDFILAAKIEALPR